MHNDFEILFILETILNRIIVITNFANTGDLDKLNWSSTGIVQNR